MYGKNTTIAVMVMTNIIKVVLGLIILPTGRPSSGLEVLTPLFPTLTTVVLPSSAVISKVGDSIVLSTVGELKVVSIIDDLTVVSTDSEVAAIFRVLNEAD